MTNTAVFYKLMIVVVITTVFIFIFLPSSVFAVLGQEERMVQEVSKAQQPPPQEEQVLKKPRVEYSAYNQRDPFDDFLIREDDNKLIDIEEKVEPPSLPVQGVVWGGEIPLAIIDNKVVKKGNVIAEAEIIEISREGVSVLYKNRVFLLSSPASAYRAAGSKEVINEK